MSEVGDRSDTRPEVLLAVLDGLPGMVGYWDRDLRNVVANRSYRQYFGLTPEEMVGVHIREVLGEAVYAANLPHIRQALAGQPQLFDRTLVDRDGQVRHTQASYIPRWEADEVTGFFVQVTDVTERVLAEQQAKRNADQYRALAASIPDGFVLLFDTALRFVIAEGQELAAFGYDKTELEGRTVREAFPEELAREVEPRYLAALAGNRVEWQREIRDRTFSLKVAPVIGDDGEIFAGIVIAQDVTAQRRALAVQSALREIAAAVAGNASTEVIARQIAVSLTKIFNVDSAAVVEFTGARSGQIIAMAPVQPKSVSRVLHFSPEDWSATAQVANTARPALVSYQDQRDGLVGALRTEGLVAGAAAPIRHNGRLWGSVALGAQTAERLNAEVLDQLTGFAELVELALTNLQAWSALSDRATRDVLTGLPNRRGLDEHLARERESVKRHRQTLSVIVVDIDHFKRINDTFGHPTGDRVLAEMATVLASVTRKSEMIARSGGEEFVWILPRTTAVAAHHAAERARETVAGHDFGEVGRLTVSLGICSSSDELEFDQLLKSADSALYEAKRKGRNQVQSQSVEHT